MKKLFSHNLISILLVSFLVLLFFLPKLIVGKIPIPADDLLGLYHPWRDSSFEGYSPGRFPVKNPLITDPVLQTYPWRYLVIKNFKEGQFPLWNPYNFSGQPLLANIQSSTFSIFNILFFLLPFNLAWTLQVILPPILTAIFAYLFLKNLNLSTPASIFGSFVLPFSGFFIAWLTWGSIIATVMWLPLMLLSILKIFVRNSLKWYLILVFCANQLILSGHWQAGSYVLITSILYALFNFLSTKKFSSFLIIIVGFFLGIITTAFQLFPSLEFINLSARELDQNYYPGRQDWFLPLQHLIQVIAPDFFGNPATYNYWGIWNWAEFVSFIGIIPLGLVLISLLNYQPKMKFFIFLAFFSLLLALENPISKLPYLYKLPFISSMQPSRVIFLLDFSLAILASFGFDYLFKLKISKKTLIGPVLILVAIIALVIYTLVFPDSFPKFENINPTDVVLRNLMIPLLTSFALIILIAVRIFLISTKFLNILIIITFVITALEIFRFGYKFTPFSKFAWVFPKTSTTQFLASQEKPFRVLTTDRRIFNGNSQSIYGIEAVHGYDPLYLKEYAQLVSSWEANLPGDPGSFNRIVTPGNYQSKITDLLNVKYIISFDNFESERFTKVHQEGETKVYLNKNGLPRAFFVNEVLKIENRKEELKKILNPDFDLAKVATSPTFSYPLTSLNTQLSITRYTDQDIQLLIITDKDAPLFISNVIYPGWQANIDGQSTPIHRSNFMFSLILVPRGTHQIEFKFHPKSFYNGLYVSAAGLFLIFLTVILWRKQFR